MGLIKRLFGESSPTPEDLQREAAAEIRQFTGPAEGPGGTSAMLSADQWESTTKAGGETAVDHEAAS